jgi:hypothetical protein
MVNQIEILEIDNLLAKILTINVRNYETFRKDATRKFGNVDNVVLSILFGGDLVPVGLWRTSDINDPAFKQDARQTVKACKDKDSELFPALCCHRQTELLYSIGIGKDYFCIFNIDTDFSLQSEVKV